jgi:hypothetical protein
MMNKTLIAKWAPGQDPTVDRPVSICWSNSAPATLDDYVLHATDTNACGHAKDGTLVMTMYPDVVATVRFDAAVGRWICEAPDGRIILDLDDPGIADDQIIAELSTYPIVYRAEIVRARISKQ